MFVPLDMLGHAKASDKTNSIKSPDSVFVQANLGELPSSLHGCVVRG